MDGYSLHLLLNFIYFVVNYKVLLICLLLHTTQYLQSLNIKYFNFETHYLHTKMLKKTFVTTKIFNNIKMF